MGSKRRIKRPRANVPRPNFDRPTFLTEHALKAGYSEAERMAIFNKVIEYLSDYLQNLGDLDFTEAHLIATNIKDSIEQQMRIRNIEVPTYADIEDGRTAKNESNFTLCKRCVMCEWHEKKKAYVCANTFVGPTKATACLFEPSEGDGCARGIPRKEYRK